MGKKEPVVKQETLEERWKLLSEPREPDLTCAGKPLVSPGDTIPGHPGLSPNQGTRVLLPPSHPALLGPWVSPSTCSWAAAAKSIFSAGVFSHSLEEQDFQKRGGREQRKNCWGGGGNKGK